MVSARPGCVRIVWDKRLLITEYVLLVPMLFILNKSWVVRFMRDGGPGIDGGPRYTGG